MTNKGKGIAYLHALLVALTSLLLVMGSPFALAAGTGLDAVVDLELREAPAVDALGVVAKLGGFSMVADGAVKGTVTANLKGLTVREMLDILSLYNGWAWNRVGSTLLVGDPARFKEAFSPISVATFPLGYASVTDVTTKLGLAIAPERLRIDARTNTVIASGTEKELAQVRQVLQSIDVPLKQVSISARVEEISTSALKNLGMDWSFNSVDLSAVQGKVSAVVGYETALKALEDSGHAVALAKPSVTTLDGQQATVHMGDKYPMLVETTLDGKVTRTVQYQDVGVRLEITPRVNVDGRVTVDLTPEVSSVAAITKDGYPQISTRTAHTVVTVRDGQTIAIGGLFQRQKLEAVHKVPVLGSIPLLGTLFSTKRVEDRETEVVVFVTLNIVDMSSPAASPDVATSSYADGSPPTVMLSGLMNAVAVGSRGEARTLVAAPSVHAVVPLTRE